MSSSCLTSLTSQLDISVRDEDGLISLRTDKWASVQSLEVANSQTSLLQQIRSSSYDCKQVKSLGGDNSKTVVIGLENGKKDVLENLPNAVNDKHTNDHGMVEHETNCHRRQAMINLHTYLNDLHGCRSLYFNNNKIPNPSPGSNILAPTENPSTRFSSRNLQQTQYLMPSVRQKKVRGVMTQLKGTD